MSPCASRLLYGSCCAHTVAPTELHSSTPRLAAVRIQKRCKQHQHNWRATQVPETYQVWSRTRNLWPKVDHCCGPSTLSLCIILDGSHRQCIALVRVTMLLCTGKFCSEWQVHSPVSHLQVSNSSTSSQSSIGTTHKVQRPTCQPAGT